MNPLSDLIVQYIGFKTQFNNADFSKWWRPSVANFKALGVESVALFKVVENEEMHFLSKNIWKQNTYFQTFPTGVAGSGSGGGIDVIQLGGFWLLPEQNLPQQEMQLAFVRKNFDNSQSKSWIKTAVSPKSPYQEMLDIPFAVKIDIPSPTLHIYCQHLMLM